MALDSAFYLVTQDIAQRAGVIGRRYKTRDGNYIVDNKDLSHVRFTTDEYMSGLSGIIKKITEQEASLLIAQGGYDKSEPEAVDEGEQEQGTNNEEQS